MNSNVIVPILNDRLNRIHATYTLRFFRQSRLTRDVGILDEMLADIAAIIELARDAGDEDLATTAKDRRDFYLQERTAIVEAQKASASSLQASWLGAQANRVAGRYRRAFAGQDRATRDLGLLAEIIKDIRQIQQRMQELAEEGRSDALEQNLEVVGRNIDLYLTERGEVVAARGMGLPQQQADVLAEVANAQFEVYRRHFAGKARLGRRPGLLQRIIDNLEQVHDRMGRQGADQLEAHVANRKMVADQLTLYHTELAKIVAMRRIHPLADIVETLRAELNVAMGEIDELLAVEPTERDLGELDTLTDGMLELERQLFELGRTGAQTERSLSLATDLAAMLEREYSDTAEVQS